MTTEHTTSRPVKLLGLSGSLRGGSHNTAVLRGLRQALAASAELRIFPLNDVTPYDGDQDGERSPAPVRALREAVADSHGVVIASPEYNYGIPGVLKNALDWASRPAMKSPFKGKPTLIMTSSQGALGGARAQQQIRETLSSMLARVVARPQVVIAGVHEKVRDGVLVDEGTLAFAVAAVEDLIEEIKLIGARDGLRENSLDVASRPEQRPATSEMRG